MPQPTQSTFRNHLLRTMAADDFALLAPHLEECDLKLGDPLYRAGDTPEYFWFPNSALGSLVATSPEGHRIEGGIFGREGFSPVGLVMGAQVSPYDCMIQSQGEAWRIKTGVLVDAVTASPSLRELLLRFAFVLSIQTTYTALSNSVHPIDERLARWLLMCHDRIIGDEMEITHEFLSLMLTVRRPSVTTALHVLEGNGFIRAERRRITIRNRAGLEEFAGDAYGIPEAQYRNLLGPLA